MTKNLMRAACYHQYGSPDVLKLEEIPVPEPAEDEVLVRVHFSTVNRTDCGFLRAQPFVVRFFSGITKPKYTTLGCEFSGEVVDLGSEVESFQLGDRVFGFKDDDYGFGGQAEYTTMSTKGMLTKIPDHMGFAEAAASLEGSHYALFGIRSTQIGKGERVLVNGATGAIGSAAVQIIRSMGAEVTAVSRSDCIDVVKSLGAINVIDYQKEDFTKLSEKFDVIMDTVGTSTFGKCKKILNPTGSYLSSEFGPFLQNPFLALYTTYFGKQQVHFPIPKNTQTDAEYIRSLMKQKQFTPLVDRTYPLTEIAEAYGYVETKQKIGNVLIDVRK